MRNENIVTKAIKEALKENSGGRTYQDRLLDPNNRKHKIIEAFQRCLAEKLLDSCSNGCQGRVGDKEDYCEYPLYKDLPGWGNVKDRADIRIEKINFEDKDYELIIEIDATRADQVAKKMMSRFCYAAILNSNMDNKRPIVYVALLYQGTKSMNSDECKKFFKMGYEELKVINKSNVLIGYIVDNNNISYNSSFIFMEKKVSCIEFDDFKTFDSNLYRRYLEDNGVRSLDSIECYMLPLNKIHKDPLKAKENQNKIIRYETFDNFKENETESFDMRDNQLSYWRKYYKYLNDKKKELGLVDENNL